MSRYRYRIDRLSNGKRLKFAWRACYIGATLCVQEQRSIDRRPPRELANYEIVRVK